MVSEIVDAGIYVCPTVFRGIAKFEGDPSYTFSERERMILVDAASVLHSRNAWLIVALCWSLETTVV